MVVVLDIVQQLSISFPPNEENLTSNVVGERDLLLVGERDLLLVGDLLLYIERFTVLLFGECGIIYIYIYIYNNDIRTNEDI